jgi:hypothetical protein
MHGFRRCNYLLFLNPQSAEQLAFSMRLVCRPSLVCMIRCTDTEFIPTKYYSQLSECLGHKNAPFHFPGGHAEKARMMYISTYMSGKT